MVCPSLGGGDLEPIDELIHLARETLNGHPDRLPELLRESAGIVLAVTRARLGNTLAAEEAALEALGRAAAGFQSVRDPDAWPKWVARVAARSALDIAKRSAGVVAPAVERASEGPRPDEAVAREEDARRIRAAVAGLPIGLREPVLLHFVEGLSYRQIAAVLGTGLGTVARRMERALASLQRSLGGEP